MHSRRFQSVERRGEAFWLPHKRRYSVLGANTYSDPGYVGEPVIREHRMAIPCLIEDSLSVAVAYRISADFRLRAHSIIRVWCVLNVQLTKK